MASDLQNLSDRMLLDDLRNAIRVRHYSRRTEEAYAGWVKRFVLFNKKRHPREMGPSEVQQFLTHLALKARWRFYSESSSVSAPVLVPGETEH